MKIRKPVVAGAFYEANKEELIKRIEWCFKHKLGPGKLSPKEEIKKRNTIGIISPHAGYIYSGPIAANGYYELSKEEKPEIVIVIGPNHHGLGKPVSIFPGGYWETPLGKVEVPKDLVKKITNKCRIIDIDEMAHLYEHSIEVQLPFLQYIYGNDFKLIPIVMLVQNPDVAIDIGDALSEIVSTKKAIVIASTDFTHYEPHDMVIKKDNEGIKKILNMDIRGLYDVIFEKNLTMCGYGGVMVLMEIAKKLNAQIVETLRHSTSGEITGDYSQVVGYASIAFKLRKDE